MSDKSIAIWVMVAALCLINAPVVLADCPSADLTGDCFVDLGDFALMANQWLTGYDPNELSMNPVIVYSVTDPCMDAAGFCHIDGSRLYMTANDARTLFIWDITKPDAPRLLSQSIVSAAEGIQSSGQYLYVTAGSTLTVIDVGDPNNPKEIFTNSFDELRNSVETKILGHFLFVTSNPVGESSRVVAIDILDPCNPQIANAAIMDPNIKAVATLTSQSKFLVAPGHLVGGKTDPVRGAIHLIDIQAPWTAFNIKSQWLDPNGGDSMGVKYMAAYGNYLLTVDPDSNKFLVFDIADANNITLTANLADNTYLKKPWGLIVSGHYAYTCSVYDDSITVLDISTPTAPQIVGYVQDHTCLDGVDDLRVSGCYIYAACNYGDRLTVLRIPGIDVPNIDTGSIRGQRLDLSENLTMGGSAFIGQGLNVGFAGIKSDGDIATRTGIVMHDLADGNNYIIQVKNGAIIVSDVNQ